MGVVRLLLHLAARDEQVRARGRDDVVTAVGGRVPDRLVLAHQDDGDAGGQPAQRGGVRGGERDVVPGAGVGEAGL